MRFVCGALAILLSGGVGAEEPEALVRQIETTKAEIVEKDKVQRQILSNLYNINKRIKEISGDRGRFTDKIMSAQADVRVTARAIAQLEGTIGEQRSDLSKHLRTLYLMSGESAARLIFSSVTPQELERNSKYLKLMTDRHYRVIKTYETSLATLLKKRQQLKGQVEHLLAVKHAAQRKEVELMGEQKAKVKILDRIRRTSKKNLEHLMTLRKEMKLDAKDSDNWLAPSIFERKGQLTLPFAGILSRSFGLIQDDEFRFRLSHKGLFFSGEAGHEVKAVFSGRVAFAGRLPGYGQAIILDHGDNYYSVYAHNAKLKVKKGEPVREGQILASSETGLYFELRHFSDAIDPQPWFKELEGLKQSQLF